MSFFDEEQDPFESIVREFFNNGNNGRQKRIISDEDEDRSIDLIDSGDKVYILFEIAGFSEEDVFVTVKGKVLEVSAEKKNHEGIKDYLARKIAAGFSYRRQLPEFVDSKSFDYTVRNGILEIKFNRNKK